VRVVKRAAVLGRLRAFVHAVVADHAGDAQPIILENGGAALGLSPAMLRRIAPFFDRGLVAEK
jgi:hypothetical protein